MSLKKVNNYRATFILDTRGYDQPVESLVEKMTKILSDLGASVKKVDNLGRRDFIRVTDRKHTGDTYVRYEFSAEANLPAALRERIRLDRQVYRLLLEAL